MILLNPSSTDSKETQILLSALKRKASSNSLSKHLQGWNTTKMTQLQNNLIKEASNSRKPADDSKG